jgi:hypothetical protein
MTDEERVQGFMETWGLEACEIRDDLLTLLADVRAENAQAPSQVEIMKRCEPRIHEVLKRLAPTKDKVTPQVLDACHREIGRIYREELIASGLGPTAATALAALLQAATRLTPKA